MNDEQPAPSLDPKAADARKRVVRRWLRRSIWALAGVLLLVSLVVAWLPKPTPVDLSEVTLGPMRVTIDEAARTRVKDRFVISAPLSGNVMRIELRPGDAVKSGDILVRIVPAASPLLDARTRAEAQARLAVSLAAQRQVEAALTRAKLTEERAQHDLKDAQHFAETGVYSRDAKDRAEFEARVRAAEVASAKFAVQMANHEVSMAQTALARVTTGREETDSFDVPAPADGVVLRVMQPSGGMSLAATPLLELGDPRALEIVCDVLTADAVRLKPGAKVELDRWGGESLQGHVRLIEPGAFTRISALGVEEQRVAVIVDLDDPREKWSALGDGFRLDAHLVVWEEPKVLRVPSSAVFRREGVWVAYVMKDDRAELREVELGQRNGPEVQVLRGLAAGEQVIVHPSDRVTPGGRIVAR